MVRIECYSAPTSLREALQLLAKYGDRARVLAGGTDLVLRLEGVDRDLEGALVNIKQVPGLVGVRAVDDVYRIGALTTVTELREDPIVAEHMPVLADICDHFASGQIRNAATIGGNLVNASPAADLAVPLLLLDARVRLASLEGDQPRERELSLGDFFRGPGVTALEAGELLTAVVVPRPPPGFRARMRKAGTRPAMDISIVSVGVGFCVDGGLIRDARVALGATAPTPLRCPAAEKTLEGRPPDAATARAAAQSAVEAARPIDDVRASAWYRRHLVRVHLEREVLHVGRG